MKIHAFHLLNDFSGSPKVLMQLCRIWIGQGHIVRISTASGRQGFLSDLDQVHERPYWYRFFANPVLRLIALIMSQMHLIFQNWRDVQLGDIVYVNTLLPFGAAILGKLRGARVIYHVHETSLRPRILRWFLMWIMRNCADEAIVVSHYVRRQMSFGMLKTRVVYNAIEDEFLVKADTNRSQKINPRNVLMICSLKAYKGPDVFVRIASARPLLRFRLVVNATEGEIVRYFQGQVLPKNLEIFPVQTNVHPFYTWADLVLNLSLPDQWVETFGLTALEAMAYGLPVIVPPVGGIAELVENGQQGYHADAREMSEVLEKIDAVLENPQAYRRMSAEARRRVSRFSETTFSAQNLAILEGRFFHTLEQDSKKWNFEEGSEIINSSLTGIDDSGTIQAFPRYVHKNIGRMKTKIAIIGTVGLPAKYGGFETLAAQLTAHLGEEFEITVYCSGPQYPKENRPTDFNGARLHYIPLQANGIQSIAYDSWSMLHAIRKADVLLVLGVAGAWMFPFLRLFSRKKIVVSIDGIEWKRAKWNLLAKWFLFWSEKMAVRHSHIDISDNEAIQDYTAMRYGTLSRIVAYGADHASKVVPTTEDKTQYPFLRAPYAFKVCRIEPENNVDMVLEAFAALPKHRLVVVGNWGNSQYGKKLRAAYAQYPNLFLLDSIYDQRGLDLLRSNAQLYVHGHSAGGTNPSLIEAMKLGLAVFAFSVSYNRSTTEGKALYFESAAQLSELVATIPVTEHLSLGLQMQQIAERRYTWSIVASQYRIIFEEAISAAPKHAVRGRFSEADSSGLLEAQAAHMLNGLSFFEKRKFQKP